MKCIFWHGLPSMIWALIWLIFLELPLAAQSLSRLSLEESTDLQIWQPIAVTPEMIDANGRLVVPTDTPARFYRMQVELIQTPADLALIFAGSFTMGRTSGDTDSDAQPVTVTVSTFYMGKNEVTKALWDVVRKWASANGYTDLAEGAGKGTNHPVQTVSWWDVIKWCNARSQKEGLTPVYTVSGSVMKTGTSVPTVNWSANGYRLPTEAEWEKAARGGVSGKRFPWGMDTISHSDANFENVGLPYHAGTTGYNLTYTIGSFPYTSPVGSFASNGFDLQDVSGNVWEWCWDYYDSGSYVEGASNPLGTNTGIGRVLRGGSWINLPYSGSLGTRCCTRGNLRPETKNGDMGFRVARSSIP